MSLPFTGPLRWEWECSNVIAIYEPSDSVRGGKVLCQIWEEPSAGCWAFDSEEQMEAVAEWIVAALNRALGAAHPPSPPPDSDPGANA